MEAQASALAWGVRCVLCRTAPCASREIAKRERDSGPAADAAKNEVPQVLFAKGVRSTRGFVRQKIRETVPRGKTAKIRRLAE